jgi:hypothetical protein
MQPWDALCTWRLTFRLNSLMHALCHFSRIRDTLVALARVKGERWAFHGFFFLITQLCLTSKRLLISYLEYTLNHPNVSNAKRVGCGKMWGRFQTKVGMDQSKHQNVARGGLLICIY